VPFRRSSIECIQPLPQGVGQAIAMVDAEALLEAIEAVGNLELVCPQE
jgi:hypothetical protein